MQSGFKSIKAKIAAEKKYLNKKFFKLYVINLFLDDGDLMADCVCDCGNMKTVYLYNLISGLTKSCGCFKSQKWSDKMRKIPYEDIEKIRKRYLDAVKNRQKLTYEELAREYGVTRQRICQIVKRGR